jgi:hypothetical protein
LRVVDGVTAGSDEPGYAALVVTTIVLGVAIGPGGREFSIGDALSWFGFV